MWSPVRISLPSARTPVRNRTVVAQSVGAGRDARSVPWCPQLKSGTKATAPSRKEGSRRLWRTSEISGQSSRIIPSIPAHVDEGPGHEQCSDFGRHCGKQVPASSQGPLTDPGHHAVAEELTAHRGHQGAGTPYLVKALDDDDSAWNLVNERPICRLGSAPDRKGFLPQEVAVTFVDGSVRMFEPRDPILIGTVTSRLGGDSRDPRGGRRTRLGQTA